DDDQSDQVILAVSDRAVILASAGAGDEVRPEAAAVIRRPDLGAGFQRVGGQRGAAQQEGGQRGAGDEAWGHGRGTSWGHGRARLTVACLCLLFGTRLKKTAGRERLPQRPPHLCYPPAVPRGQVFPGRVLNSLKGVRALRVGPGCRTG